MGGIISSITSAVGSIFGGGSKSIRIPAPPPALVFDASAERAKAAEEERQRAAKRRGRASTIVGGARGGLLNPEETETTGTIKLLGR